MQKLLLLGDEAIAQAFIDAGGSAINSYPGTPSTQITEYVIKSKEAKANGVIANWCANEKTALEASIGVAYAGKVHSYIDTSELFGINPLSDDAYYNYEAEFYPYEQFYSATKKEKVDLVMINRTSELSVRGLEVKLTTLPDNTTKDLPDADYGSEIVVRSPTILFLACSICSCYKTDKEKGVLHGLLNTIGSEIKNWSEIRHVLPHYDAIRKAILSVSANLAKKQIPLIIQPIWKTDRKLKDFAEDCLDVFVWSNLSVIQMCLRETNTKEDISRNQRTIIWLYKMLWDYTQFGRFNYTDIVNDLAYNYKTDKAFAISGKLTNPQCKIDNGIRETQYGDGQGTRFDVGTVSRCLCHY